MGKKTKTKQKNKQTKNPHQTLDEKLAAVNEVTMFTKHNKIHIYFSILKAC